MILTKERFRYGFLLNVTRQNRYSSSSRALFLGLLLCVPILCGQISLAQTGKPTAVSPQIPRSAPPSAFKVPLLTEPLRLSDFHDMRPDPAIKDNLALVTGFIQNTPTDGAPATQQTDVWIAHTQVHPLFRLRLSRRPSRLDSPSPVSSRRHNRRRHRFSPPRSLRRPAPGSDVHRQPRRCAGRCRVDR